MLGPTTYQLPISARPVCSHWHAHHQGYSNSLGTVGAQPVVVEVHIRFLHVPEEVGDRHYAHQFAGLQVQLFLSGGEKFLSICRKKYRLNGVSLLSLPYRPRLHLLLRICPCGCMPWRAIPTGKSASGGRGDPDSRKLQMDFAFWVRDKTPGFRPHAFLGEGAECSTPTLLGWLCPVTKDV